MAVYVTSRMFNKLNNAKYPSNMHYIDEGSCSSDHWQKLISDRLKHIFLILKEQMTIDVARKLSKAAERLSKDSICRVCARPATTPLTDKIYNYDIMSAIRSITNVTVDIEDSLPKYICNECLETLKISWLFKKKCENSDRKFKNILNPMGDPSLHSYPYSKHDFQLILHQMKLKRTKIAEKKEMERRKRERMLEKKNPKVKQFKCSPCDMIFANKESLVAHRRQRQCMRRACDICGQLVLSITQHMRHIHKESVPHRCPTCGKEFPIIARLKHHMVVHTNTFNFFCDLCPYKCKHKYYLVMHMRTHTGEKPYKCSDCPATFVNPSNLNKHKLIHQDKQFKCMLCEKAFRTSSVLREHHEAAHMNIKHTCNFCGRDFCYKSDLRKHEIRSHNRSKRDYVGGEPTYKQVERLQKMQDNTDGPTLMDKWHQEVVTVTQPTPVVQATYIDQSANTHTLYFSDLSGTLHQPQLVQQPLENVTLSDLLKKDPAKIYESQQTIGYF